MSKTLKLIEATRHPSCERLLSKLAPSEAGCLLFTGARSGTGYGNFWFKGRYVGPHRFVWEIVNGAIPDGLFVLHRCDVKPCCELEHLSLGTPLENMHDMIRKGRQRYTHAEELAQRTHCPKGHPFSGSNLYTRPDGARSCRTCETVRQHVRYLAGKSRASQVA